MGIASKMTEGGGAKPVSFRNVGDLVEGAVTRIREQQATDIHGNKETWPDGEPKMMVIWTVQTNTREDDRDDGLRDIYAKGGIYTAIRGALQASFPPGFEDSDVLGCILRVQFTGTMPPTQRGFSPRKLYEAKFTKVERNIEARTAGTTSRTDGNDEDIPF